MEKLTKYKLWFWSFVALFLLVVLNQFSNHVLHKDKWVEAQAVIISKDTRDRIRRRGRPLSDNKTYSISYIYAFDAETALSYQSEKSLNRGLKSHRQMRKQQPSEYKKYSNKIDLSSMVMDTFSLDLSTYRQLSVGQDITIIYREDVPWESRPKDWSYPPLD